MDDFDKCLPGLKTADDLLTQCPLLDMTDEGLNNRQCHIGFKQRNADLTQGLPDTIFGQTPFATQFLHGFGESLA
jgi:hypothetical protein